MSVASLPGIDPEVVALCDALNGMPGVHTIESCSGHGREPIQVWFRVARMNQVAPVLYWFDGCHCSWYGWQVLASTDCGGKRTTFEARGPVGAYHEADGIAARLRGDLDEWMRILRTQQ